MTSNEDNSDQVYILGDYAIDSHFFVDKERPGVDEHSNYLHYDKIHQSNIFGGTQLLGKFVKNGIANEDVVNFYDIEEDYKNQKKDPVPQMGIPFSYSIITEFGKGEEKKYRSQYILGYQDSTPNIKDEKRGDSIADKILNLITEIHDNQFVILNDYGTVLRKNKIIRSALIEKTEGLSIKFVLKMHKPLFKGPLWTWISKKDPVVVINSNDLRSCGLDFSRGLSWEKTVNDIFFRIFSQDDDNHVVTELRKVRHLMIWFDVDGVLYLNKIDKSSYLATVIYDPSHVEEGNKHSIQGTLPGLMSAFFGTFVANIANKKLNWLTDKNDDSKNPNDPLFNDHRIIVASTVAGMNVALSLLREGFENQKKITPKKSEQKDTKKSMVFNYPFNKLKKPEETFSFVKKTVTARDLFDLSDWSIINESGSHFIHRESRKIVREGFDSIKKSLPYAQFGKFITFDRTEIEIYKEIEKLFRKYLDSERPGSKEKLIYAIGVFGPPGCGKSFGIEELSKSVGGDNFKIIKINLSQLKSPNELTIRFQEIRNATLTGKKPVVIIDEFDSKCEKENLGWIKYFLAPIQDGEFSDTNGIHSIGNAFFVFTGGTCDTLNEFAEGPHTLSEGERIKYLSDFKAKKGPDFTSRLIGHINIRGPNKVDSADSFWIIRRAVLLRSLIEKNMPSIISEKEGVKKANIDNNLISAFLETPSYRHGARSMEAIIRMSATKNEKRFSFSDIPSIEQLNPHVDGVHFYKGLRNKKVASYQIIEDLAKSQFKFIGKYFNDRKEEPEIYDEYVYKTMKVWDTKGLDLAEQEPYFRDSEFILEILKVLGLEYTKYSKPIKITGKKGFNLAPEILRRVIVLEHDRWIIDRVSMGWIFQETHVFGLKGFSCLRPLNTYEQDTSDISSEEYRHILHFLTKYINMLPVIFSEAGYSVSNLNLTDQKIKEIDNRITNYYADNESYINRQNRELSIRSKYHIEKLAQSLFTHQTELMKMYFGSVSSRDFEYKDLPRRKKIYLESWSKSIAEDLCEKKLSIIPYFKNLGNPKFSLIVSNDLVTTKEEQPHGEEKLDLITEEMMISGADAEMQQCAEEKMKLSAKELSKQDTIDLAHVIHRRWVKYLEQNGWKSSDKSNYSEKTSAMLRSFSDLEDKQKSLLFKIASNYPKILEESEILLYRLNVPIKAEF